jgi:hypothetical protein
MRWQRTKLRVLYLKGARLIGGEWRRGTLRKTVDTSVDELSLPSGFRGRALLLDGGEDLQHQVVSIPERGKSSLRKVMAHEIETLMNAAPADFVYDWRTIGRQVEEGTSQGAYLLAGHTRAVIAPLVERLAQAGVKVTNVISSLDLMIEKGRALHGKGGSALMVFEEPVVHFLFFRDGIYGFQRSFELREEGFQKDFLLEIQRSFFYTKQKFKIPIERVTVLLAPPWLQADIAAQLQETLGFPVDFLSPTLEECESPELQLLNVLIRETASVPSFLNLLPAELKRELKTRKLCWLVGSAALVMLGLALGWTGQTRDSLQESWAMLSVREKELKGVEARVESEREKIERFNQLEEEAAAVRARLDQKRSLHLYLEALPFVVPPQVHFESITWGKRTSEMTVQPSSDPSQLGQPAGATHIRISGKVDAVSSDDRYARFAELVENLKAAPFTEKVDYQSNELLRAGLFQLDLQVKEIRSGNGAH